LKILYIDPYSNTPYSKQYLYYEGLYHALCKSNDVFLYRDCFTNYNKIKKEIPFTPDIVLFGLSWFEKHKYFQKIKNLDFFKICYFNKPSVNYKDKINFCNVNEIDRIITPHTFYKKLEKESGRKVELFPYGFDPNIFFPRHQIEKEYDIGFSGALHGEHNYPGGAFKNPNIRLKIRNILYQIKNLKYYWKSSDNYETARIHDINEYANKLNASKSWIATQAAYGDITPRYFEVMGSGSLLFCEQNPTEYKDIFINGMNCIEFNNSLDDFSLKLKKLLNNGSEIEMIQKNAIFDAQNKHTWDKRSEQLIKLIN